MLGGFYEGGKADVKLMITADPGNKNAFLTNDLVVNITYNDGTGNMGKDYSPVVYQIVIPAGTPLAPGATMERPFFVGLPDNMLTDGSRTFTAKISSASGTNGGSVNTNNLGVKILDDILDPDGPTITLTGTSGTLQGTDGVNYISEDITSPPIELSFSSSLLPIEDVTMTMRFAGDLSRINANSIEYYDSAANAWVSTALNGRNFNIVLREGYNKISLRFKVADDALSNGNDELSLSVAAIRGSEGHVPAGAPQTFSFTVVDDATAYKENGMNFGAHPDGPQIRLMPPTEPIINESGETTYITMETLAAAPVNETTAVDLRLTDGLLDRVAVYGRLGLPWVTGGKYLKVIVGGRNVFAEVSADGILRVELPAGSKSARLELKGKNNMEDDGTREYSVELVAVNGSECSIATGNAVSKIIIEDAPGNPRMLRSMFFGEDDDSAALNAAAQEEIADAYLGSQAGEDNPASLLSALVQERADDLLLPDSSEHFWGSDLISAEGAVWPLGSGALLVDGETDSAPDNTTALLAQGIEKGESHGQLPDDGVGRADADAIGLSDPLLDGAFNGDLFRGSSQADVAPDAAGLALPVFSGNEESSFFDMPVSPGAALLWELTAAEDNLNFEEGLRLALVPQDAAQHADAAQHTDAAQHADAALFSSEQSPSGGGNMSVEAIFFPAKEELPDLLGFY